jgi:hypothetical protein
VSESIDPRRPDYGSSGPEELRPEAHLSGADLEAHLADCLTQAAKYLAMADADVRRRDLLESRWTREQRLENLKHLSVIEALAAVDGQDWAMADLPTRMSVVGEEVERRHEADRGRDPELELLIERKAELWQRICQAQGGHASLTVAARPYVDELDLINRAIERCRRVLDQQECP